MVSMTDIDKDTVDKSYQRLAVALRRLVARARDSAAGYQKAAEETVDDFLRPQFERLADERHRLAATLATVAKDLSIDISEAEDSTLGDVHRAFLGIKVKLMRGDPQAILSEVARGEAAFERLFERVLHHGMPKSARRKLQTQHRIVREARDRYRSLARRVRRSGSITSRRLAQVGTSARQHPIATVGIIAISAVVLGAVAALASHDKPRWSLDMRQLRGLDKRLRQLETRGRRQIEDYRPHDLEERARSGLESISRHLRGYR